MKKSYDNTIRKRSDNTIRKRLKENRDECISCLRAYGDYSWGTTRENINKTITLLNKIMRGIPVDAWPCYEEEMRHIVDGNWTIKLSWYENRRTADLCYRHDDHTAWVIESRKNKGTYINFDIGGS